MDQPESRPARRPWYSPLRLARTLAICAAVSYGALCGYLYLAQNSLQYPRYVAHCDPSAAEAARQLREAGLVPCSFTPRGRMAPGPQGYYRSDFSRAARRGTIVVFHGNGSWAAERSIYVAAFLRRDFRPFLYEYPGYGTRPGYPSEAAIVPDAREVIRQLDAGGFGPVYVWGESLGSGVAAAVCADPALPVHGLVLVTPWDNLANVGLYRFPFMPVRWLLTDRYDSVANLQGFHHPVCVIQSSMDEIIPAALTKNLFAHLPPPKKLIMQKGYRHGNWPSAPELNWWSEALDFVAGA